MILEQLKQIVYKTAGQEDIGLQGELLMGALKMTE